MPDSKWFRRVKRWWPIGRFVIGIALGAFALWTLNGQRGELAGATAELSHLHTQYIALGAFSEILSLSAFAGMQVWLLRCGDVHVSLPRVIGITFGSGAIANSIPGGPAVSSVFAFRQYRRAGADEAIAGWTLIATLTCAGLSLMLLATAGVLIAERQGASDDLIGVTIGATIVAVALSVIVWQRRMAVGIAAALVRLSQKLTGRPRGEAAVAVRSVLRHLKTVHLRVRDLAGALAWALANWCLDCGCLVCCYYAVGAQVPVRGLLLAYGAAQLASNLPITPGGLGVVEGSLTIGLVYYGGVEVSTVAAVLLYRIISFWGFLPVGWTAWGGVTYANRRADRLAAAGGDEGASGGEEGMTAAEAGGSSDNLGLSVGGVT